jgi:lipopolysaccharide transport system ATP-binding protein
MQPAIRVENLSKRYRLGATRVDNNLTENLKAGLGRVWRGLTGREKSAATESNDFWALKDVSFEVKPGEVVGIIGRNGAGKSTLLKVLSRIVEPTGGRATVRGRMGSLLEVGTGFHPELTGRENVYLNGSILGMSQKEIARKFDEIVAFSGVEKFLDTPVKRYSSGMYVRLAFAVAAHLEPEILIVDEVLAVGDAEFQQRCLSRMGTIAEEGRTVLFVSHNMPAVRNLTNRCAYLQRGQIVCVGETKSVIDRYLGDSFTARTTQQDEGEGLDYYRRGKTNDAIRFRRVWFTTPTGDKVESFRVGDSFAINLLIESKENCPQACVAFGLANQNSERVTTIYSRDQSFSLTIRPGEQHVRAVVRGLPLSPGRYLCTVGLNRNANSTAFDVIVDYPAFEVTMPEIESGEIDWPHRPWGAVHWSDVVWSARQGADLS